MLVPQMKAARSEARNATAFAISSGVPQRPSGTSAPQPRFLLFEATAEIDFVVQLERVGQRAPDAARAYGVDEDLVLREIVGQRFDEGVLRRIGDRGGDGVRLRHFSGLADDDDEAPTALPAHVRRNLTRQFPRADHFRLEMPEQYIGRDVVDTSGDVRAGIAHHDVDAAEGVDGILDQSRNISRLADIGDETFGLCRFEFCDRGIELGALASANRDPATLRAETLRNGEADPARAARDQRRLAGESEIHAGNSAENIAVIAAIDADRAAGREVRAVRTRKATRSATSSGCRFARAGWRA